MGRSSQNDQVGAASRAIGGVRELGDRPGSNRRGSFSLVGHVPHDSRHAGHPGLPGNRSPDGPQAYYGKDVGTHRQ